MTIFDKPCKSWWTLVLASKKAKYDWVKSEPLRHVWTIFNAYWYPSINLKLEIWAHRNPLSENQALVFVQEAK